MMVCGPFGTFSNVVDDCICRGGCRSKRTVASLGPCTASTTVVTGCSTVFHRATPTAPTMRVMPSAAANSFGAFDGGFVATGGAAGNDAFDVVGDVVSCRCS